MQPQVEKQIILIAASGTLTERSPLSDEWIGRYMVFDFNEQNKPGTTTSTASSHNTVRPTQPRGNQTKLSFSHQTRDNNQRFSNLNMRPVGGIQGIVPDVDPRDEKLVLVRLTKNSASTTTEAQDEDEQRTKTRRDSEKNTSYAGFYVSKNPDTTVAFRELATRSISEVKVSPI
ncbi:hypothetical protein JCM33374_g1292 [Metschnikowia sp. JCM 33374]|nr:hypothetical protein JCM33374_g1292 [Metschnikowia sp. JCM 33374]